MKKEKTVRLLIVDNSSDDAEMMANLLRRSGYGVRVTRVERQEEIETALEGQTPDLIVSAVKLAGVDVQQMLTRIRESGKDIPVVVVTDDNKDHALALEALRNGARDLVQKDQSERLQIVLIRELSDLDLRRAHRLCETSLRETEKRNRLLLDSSRDAIAYVHDGMHIYANAAYLTMFGYLTAEEVEGTPVMDMVAAVDHARFKDFLRNYDKGGQARDIDLQGRHNEGKEFKLKMEFSPASVDGEACTQIIIRDLSQNRELQEKIKALSRQDLLTGLYNHGYFTGLLDAAVAKAVSGEASTMLYIGIDNLQQTRESAGIAAGNMVLGHVATLLREQLGEKGIAARFSDDVFTILLQGGAIAEAQKLAEVLRKAVEDAVFDADGRSATLTCSICVCAISETVANSRELMLGISRACVAARIAGGNRVQLYNPVVEARGIREELRHWSVQIQSALDNNRFRLVYQPIVSLRGSTDENYQVLLRMLDEQGNEMQPEQFMPGAEQVALMGAVDRWVIERAVKLLAARRQTGHKTNFFIKLFVDTMMDKTLLPWISAAIKAVRLAGDGLVFEVREASAVSNLRETKDFINGLKELHCRFALNHSSSGDEPARFNYLKHLPVDYLKISGALMPGIAGIPENQEIVKRINEAAHHVKIATVAECVEDAATLALLWQYGIDYAQGYYFQKPGETLTYDFSGDHA